MGVREALHQNTRITIGVAAVVILGAIGIVATTGFGTDGMDIGGSSGKAFFSDDNGKTFFVDDVARRPPFDHHGKTAYLAFVWTCDGGKTKFVSHLQRYTQDAQLKVEEAMKKNPPDPAMWEKISMSGIEVKAANVPDEPKNWYKSNDPNRLKVIEPRCPDGIHQKPERVLP